MPTSEYSLEFVHPDGRVHCREFGTKAQCLELAERDAKYLAREFPKPWKQRIRLCNPVGVK